MKEEIIYYQNFKLRSSKELEQLASLAFRIEGVKQPSIELTYKHDRKKVNDALNILEHYLKNDVVAAIYNGSDSEKVKKLLKETLKEDFLDELADIHFEQVNHFSLIKNAKINKKIIREFSYHDSMIFLLYLDHLEIISFGETVAIMQPLDDETIVGLSRLFSIPYHDLYLALMLLELDSEIRNAYLAILDSTLMSSIKMSPILIRHKQFSRNLKISERSKVLKTLYEEAVLDFAKDYSFNLIYNFVYKI